MTDDLVPGAAKRSDLEDLEGGSSRRSLFTPGLLRFAGAAFKAVLAGFQPPDPVEQLKFRIMQHELARLAGEASIAVERIPFVALAASGRDYVVSGVRGGGKTACAVALGQAFAEIHQRAFVVVDWPEWAADAVGAASVPVNRVRRVRDSVIVFDEASLRIKSGRRDDLLYSVLALARQRGNVLLWTAQSLAGIGRDVLRMGVGMIWKRTDPTALKMEREELVEVVSQARSIQDQYELGGRPETAIALVDGQWFVAEDCPLPNGWSEEVSCLWRDEP